MSNLILKIERPAYGGMSIARHEGKVVMIKGAVLPGETVEAVIESEKKDYLTASLRKVLEPSTDRIRPACKFFGSCGGCHLQHIPYNMQVRMKEDLLRDALKRLSKTEPDLAGPIINENPWNYRYRGQFKVSGGGIGFYKANTRDLVKIDSCPLMLPEINGYLQKTKTLLEAVNSKEIHITWGDGSTALIKLQSRTMSRAGLDRSAAMFLDAGFKGIFIETADKKMSVHGNPFTALDLGDLKCFVSPASFFQSNWKLNLSVVKIIKEHLGSLKNRRVLDLYAGAGNFSLPLAEDAEITAVEENPYSIKDGRRNLDINNINNCRFVRSSAEKYRSKSNFDVIILDPPRPGLTKKAMENVLSLQPEKIVYISCNPSTFARDIKKLSARYDIESVRMVDFFPQTFHIESLAFLRLR